MNLHGAPPPPPPPPPFPPPPPPAPLVLPPPLLLIIVQFFSVVDQCSSLTPERAKTQIQKKNVLSYALLPW